MKKRILSLLLAIMLCFTMVPVLDAQAADHVTSTYSLSNWVIDDLIIGDNYGIYPMEWYNSDMTASISKSKLTILLDSMKNKIVKTNCVTQNTKISYKLKNKMTVKEVLDTYNKMLSSMKFSKSLGLKGKTSLDNMKKMGVYTGSKKEPALSKLCSVEAACVYGTRVITYLYNKLGAASKGFFWVAKSGKNKVYMLGSIHLASTEIYPFSKKIIDAYKSSDSLVVELDANDYNGALQLVNMGLYNDGTTLKDHISGETFKKVIDLAEKYGYSENMISKFKPWYINILFASLSYTKSGERSEAAEAANLGIDMNFISNAYYYGKPIKEVEGYVKQAQVLDSFSDELQNVLLNETVDSVNKVVNGDDTAYADYLEQALKLWHDGDVEGFLKFNSEQEEYSDDYDYSSLDQALADEYENKLMNQRDLGMADYIDNLLKADGSFTYFVVVGSGHFISDYSVLDILKSRGYEISQIK